MTGRKTVKELERGIKIVLVPEGEGECDEVQSHLVIQESDSFTTELEEFPTLGQAENWADGYERAVGTAIGNVVDDEESIILEENEMGERLIANISKDGVYIDHNWSEGALYLPEDSLRMLAEEVEKHDLSSQR